MSSELMLEEFASFLIDVRGSSQRTAQAYRRDVAAYADYLASLQNPPGLPEGLTKTRLGLYLIERTAPGKRAADKPERLSLRSAARITSALKAYAGFLISRDKLRDDPLAGFKPPRYNRTLPEYFNCEELQALITAFDGSSLPLDLRNAALLRLIYACGLRVAECASLDIGDLRLAEGWLSVTGKGSKQRVVPFGEQPADAVRRWLEAGRPKLSGPASRQALWLNNRGGRLSDRAMRDVLNKAALQAGQLKHLSPHKLRHACATHMLEGGADVRLVQELLGHASLSTTQVYTQVTRRQLLEVYEKTHPRAERDDDC